MAKLNFPSLRELMSRMTDPSNVTTPKLIEILSQPQFYRRVATYAFLEDSTLARLKAYRQLVAEGSPKQRIVLAEAVTPFMRHTRDLARKDADLLVPLGQYLSELLGAQPEFNIRFCGPGGCFKVTIPTAPKSNAT